MDKRELEIVEKLREIFLSEGKSYDDYWDSSEVLQAYDETLGRRIRWKWDSVLSAVKSRAPSFSPLDVVDWGCGSGVASEALLDHFPELAKKTFHPIDRSQLAQKFTEKKLTDRNVAITKTFPTSPYLLLVSHVATELRERHWEELFSTMKRAEAIIWVEPGTPPVSQRIIAFRERLREAFSIVAPCPHQQACGLFGAQRDWCHFFADVPSQIHQDPQWKKLSQTLGIDLRSLPTSYLVLRREKFLEGDTDEGRLIGRPRLYKGYASSLICRVNGVEEEKFLKRDKTGPYERLKKEAGFFVSISRKKQ